MVLAAAQVCTYASTSCGGFQAMATRGYLLADVKNSGYVAADYTLSVVNCTAGVLPVLVRVIAAVPLLYFLLWAIYILEAC